MISNFESSIDLNGASVLITGGTGSFGKRFARTLLEKFELRRLIILSRDELKQFEMANEPAFQNQKCLRFFIGDVRERDRLEMAMRDIDFVVHAAALKQVPTAEYNPFECIHTNVMGAENVVQAAIRTGVKKVIALSTDKAANPINLYGASKLASDKIFVAANHLSGTDGTLFSVVRYGNVLNSRGSVIPFFRNLVENGATSVPITDERMTRFWITLQQGVNFVLSCLDGMRGGEVYVPKIPSMKIVDLATALVPGVEQRIVGIRPGEKLHEVMVSEDDCHTTIEFDDRYIIQPAFSWWPGESYLEDGAKPVAEGFSYSSGKNTEWLDANSLLIMLQEQAGGK
jgi:UDP-N-acetylglucosamine 4,6-dehydratase